MLVVWLVACAGADRDGDGFGAPGDCDDRDPSVHPGAADTPGDGVDSDCDGYDLPSERLDQIDQVERWSSGNRTPYLEFGFDFQVADLDGDGFDDVFAGSQEIAGEDYRPGEAWVLAGPDGTSAAHWKGAPLGPQLLGQFVDVAATLDGPPQLFMRALEGVWVLATGSDSGYPGGVGGRLLGNDPEGYLVGNDLHAVDLLGSPDEDLVASCGRDEGSTWLAAICIQEGPITSSGRIGDATLVIDGPGDFGTAFADLDFDGDGQPDLAVGDDNTTDEAGTVSLFLGPMTPGHYDVPPLDRQWTGEYARDWFGGHLFAGDLDGDGVEELLADAMAWPTGNRSGRLYALTPDVTDIADAPLLIDGDPGLQHLGVGAAVADLDGDGAADLAVGSPALASLDPDVRGRVMLFYGPLAGHLSSEDAGRIFSGAATGDQTGWTVRTGDTNGDGDTDLLISAPLADGPTPETGHIYVLEGPLPPW
ncbi:MAG: FG-GAP-like repeat-containing protein [Myxococcota bacterium]